MGYSLALVHLKSLEKWPTNAKSIRTHHQRLIQGYVVRVKDAQQVLVAWNVSDTFHTIMFFNRTSRKRSVG